MEVGKPTHFTVLTKGAGKAKLDVHFAGAAKGEAVRDFEIIDNHDYSYTVKYTAVQQVCLVLRLSLCCCWGLNVRSSTSDPFWVLGPSLWISELRSPGSCYQVISKPLRLSLVPNRATWQ